MKKSLLSDNINYSVFIPLVSQCRKLRNQDISKYHIQLSIAMFCMLVVFSAGIDKTEVYVGCIVVSMLIHYFTLVAILWMGAEALLMFQKLVLVFTTITKRFIVILSIVCWCKFARTHIIAIRLENIMLA